MWRDVTVSDVTEFSSGHETCKAPLPIISINFALTNITHVRHDTARLHIISWQGAGAHKIHEVFFVQK